MHFLHLVLCIRGLSPRILHLILHQSCTNLHLILHQTYTRGEGLWAFRFHVEAVDAVLRAIAEAFLEQELADFLQRWYVGGG